MTSVQKQIQDQCVQVYIPTQNVQPASIFFDSDQMNQTEQSNSKAICYLATSCHASFSALSLISESSSDTSLLKGFLKINFTHFVDIETF